METAGMVETTKKKVFINWSLAWPSVNLLDHNWHGHCLHDSQDVPGVNHIKLPTFTDTVVGNGEQFKITFIIAH